MSGVQGTILLLDVSGVQEPVLLLNVDESGVQVAMLLIFMFIYRGLSCIRPWLVNRSLCCF